jgi:hypothetical protein
MEKIIVKQEENMQTILITSKETIHTKLHSHDMGVIKIIVSGKYV